MAQVNRGRLPERVVHARGGAAPRPLRGDRRRHPVDQRFSDLIHSRRRRADTNLRDHNMQWDFWTRTPELAHQVTLLMTDRGTPRGWRTMNGYGSHTFMWVNRGGERFWIKYTFTTDQGIENLTDAEAAAMVSEDPAHHIRDLHSSIRNGNRPSWTMHVQVEQAAFEPANMVPGIGPSPDRMLQGRLFSHPDTHRHRVGPEMLRSAEVLHPEDDDVGQPRALWERVPSPVDREHLIGNIAGHMSRGLTPEMVTRVIAHWTSVHPDLGAGVARAVNRARQPVGGPAGG